MMTPERRLTERHPIEIDAVIITPTASVPAQVVDIGAGGIRLISPEPILPETNIALSLATEEETLLSGTILWTLEIHVKNSSPVFEVGIEADAFFLKDQEAIGFSDKETVVREILSRVQRSLHR